MSTIDDYVKMQFGSEHSEKLKNIRQGGDNNCRGSSFEHAYAVYKIFVILAESFDHRDDFCISSQDVAFVDDLCIYRRSTQEKTNYQIKNSDGTAADLTPEIIDRFRMQRIIDRRFHRCFESLQVLLVSCKQKSLSNEKKIINKYKYYWMRSEYFPYYDGCTNFIKNCPELRKSIECVCNSSALDNVEAAYRLILAVWCDRSASGIKSTVKEIFDLAKKTSNLNPFSQLEQLAPIPYWLTDKCRNLAVDVREEFGRYIISRNGFEFSISASGVAPSQDELLNIITVPQLFQFFISQAATELTA